MPRPLTKASGCYNTVESNSDKKQKFAIYIVNFPFRYFLNVEMCFCFVCMTVLFAADINRLNLDVCQE